MECNDPEVLKIVESLSQELKIKMIKVFVYDFGYFKRIDSLFNEKRTLYGYTT
jgi:hypothetical protein